MTKNLAYKVLNRDGTPYHGGHGKWDLPKHRKPGRWKTVYGDLKPCRNGLHLCPKKDLLFWIGPAVWLVEYSGEVVDREDKIVVRKARLIKRVTRWNQKTTRLFAADCAAHVLHVFEKKHRMDKRPREAITVARAFARGKITKRMLSDAYDLAWDASKNTIESASWHAAWAARSAVSDRYMDVRDVASNAACAERERFSTASNREAAWKAERKWQTKRLFEYLEGKRK